MHKTPIKYCLILLTACAVLWGTCAPGSAELITAEPPAQLSAEAEETAVPEENALAVRFVRQESAGLIAPGEIFDGENLLVEYARPDREKIRMPAGSGYTKGPIGVAAFRNDAFRRNASFGTVTRPDTLKVLWRTETGGGQVSGQPAIVKWSVQVRTLSNLYAEKLDKSGLREVILACGDGVIRFLDADDGTPTRDPLETGVPMTGTPSLHPLGFPYMTAGRRMEEVEARTGRNGLLQYNLYNAQEIPGDLALTGSFGTSSLIDRTSNTVVSAGGNGLLCLTSLNTEFDYASGILEVRPSSAVLSSGAEIASAHAMYDRFVFYADLDGVLRCVDTDTLTPVWAAETGDAVLAAVALDQPENSETLDLYTANVLHARENGDAQIRRVNALDGTEIWCTGIGVDRAPEGEPDAGCAASPVIGENGLRDLVYYTVNGLNGEGRNFLGIPEEAGSSVVALEKETGRVRWARGLAGACVSSPVAVYDEDGNGWIVQCTENGTIVLLEGLTGSETASLALDGRIEASPAVYRCLLVVPVTDGGENAVYGIYLGSTEGYDMYAEKASAASPEETPAPVPEIPEISRTETDRMVERMIGFYSYWSVNRQEDMLSYCDPRWTAENEDPKLSLFVLLANRTPQSVTILQVSGTEADDERDVTVNSLISRNNGNPAELYRMTVRMVRADGEWYVDPESLRTYEILETETPEPDPAGTPEPAGMPEATADSPETKQAPAEADLLLYWNPEGGRFYHADPECKSVHPKFLPLTASFLYAEVNEETYRGLEPCGVCGAPQRP